MITHIKFWDGFATELPCIGNKVYEFKPGINVLFGPNGCGKSTILKTIKGYCGIAGGGWTFFNDPMALAANTFPMAYMALSPGKCRADVGWDGTPSFFNDGDIKTENTFFYVPATSRGSDDGITSDSEHLDLLAEKPSSGQYRIKKINKILNMVHTPPTYTQADIPPGYKFSDCEKELEYWNKLSHTGPQTILFDEPERALSLPMQKKFLCEVLSQFKDKQIILATHSLFVLLMKDTNIIDMEPGYVEECRSLL